MIFKHTRLVTNLLLLWVALFMLGLGGCSHPSRKDSNDKANSLNQADSYDEEWSLWHEIPGITLYLVPMDGITSTEIQKVAEDFQKNFGDRQWEGYVVEILPHTTSPDSCLNLTRKRLRAEKLINMLNSKYLEECRKKSDAKGIVDSNFHIMGVTDRDISTTVDNHSDRRVMGHSLPYEKSVSVVSTYRLKDMNNLWKLTAHEFCHGFYNCPDCKNHDPHCLMANINVRAPHFELRDSLCLDCGGFFLIGD